MEEANSLIAIDLMNPDLPGDEGRSPLRKGTLHLFRAKLLWQGACHEHIRVTHHGSEPTQVRLELTLRGGLRRSVRIARHAARAPRRAPAGRESVPARWCFRTAAWTDWCGAAGSISIRRRPRSTRGAPSSICGWIPAREYHLYCVVRCERDGDAQQPFRSYEAALRENNAARHAWLDGHCQVITSNALVNLWLHRSVADLAMLTTPVADTARIRTPACRGTRPPSGATASSPRWSACGSTRRWRAACWASWPRRRPTELDPQRDAEPGKILHEARDGEMARTGEIPFGRYYGSVDATPLFVMLAGAYWRRTGDLRADPRASGRTSRRRCDGSTSYGDRDGDGFVEYARRSEEGLDPAGLEGLARLGLPRGRRAGRGADRAVRGAGLRLRSQACARRQLARADGRRPAGRGR